MSHCEVVIGSGVGRFAGFTTTDQQSPGGVDRLGQMATFQQTFDGTAMSIKLGVAPRMVAAQRLQTGGGLDAD